ncbi:hypothetical protein CCH79_00015832 [Gambusia affinis]|uniref:C-type lectin domain-containing protein n=1 Tax=Gambusia affinis TaxID=33528 RepID=A0A315VAR9_GAMAF|nr:hypothetical protein CCH79_00015832 [Gambusia affinis]
MKTLISTSAGDQRGAWIGLYDQTNGIKTWYWSQSEVEFNKSETNWNPSTSEPNDVGGVENCGFMLNTLKWGDLSCNTLSIFLCYSAFFASVFSFRCIETSGSKTFHLIQETKTWLEAQSYCREKHTDLASGMEQLQDEEVQKEISSTGSYIFIGLFRDTWRWSDGSSFSFRHWNLKFDNQIINSGQCAMTVFDDGGRWKNENCNERKPFICYDDKVILIKEKMNWEEALHYCRDHHHDLVTITKMDDQRWIQEKVKVASTGYVWMGLRFHCTLNFWFWVCPGMTTLNISAGATDDCNISGCMDVRGRHSALSIETKQKKKFQVIKEKKTWLKAQSYCRDQHTDLVSGTNHLKNPQLHKRDQICEHIHVSRPVHGRQVFGQMEAVSLSDTGMKSLMRSCREELGAWRVVIVLMKADFHKTPLEHREPEENKNRNQGKIDSNRTTFNVP